MCLHTVLAYSVWAPFTLWLGQNRSFTGHTACFLCQESEPVLSTTVALRRKGLSLGVYTVSFRIFAFVM